MNSIRDILDDVTGVMFHLRKNNAPTYWVTLGCIGLIFWSIAALIFQRTGMFLLGMIAFAFIVNSLCNSWIRLREAEEAAEEKAKKALERERKRNRYLSDPDKSES